MQDHLPRTWPEFFEDLAIGLIVLLGGTRACMWFLLMVLAIVWGLSR
jgi:hypothetical protein